MKPLFVDMDGVINCFAEYFLDYIKSSYGVGINTPLYGYDISKWFNYWGRENKVIKDTFNSSTFWASIPPNTEIINELKELGDYYIVTYPSDWDVCASIKERWIRKYLPELNVNTNLIMMKHKYLLAGNGVLVDDNPEFVKEFIDNGGETYLFETFYNHKEDLPKIKSLKEIV